jgi:hypothetical protein
VRAIRNATAAHFAKTGHDFDFAPTGLVLMLALMMRHVVPSKCPKDAKQTEGL